MRVCHVITRLIVGGAQENTLLTCEALRARGHEVILITGPTHGPEGSLVGRATAGGYRLIELPALVRPIHPVQDARALFALLGLFRGLRPEIVHTHSSKAGILARLAAAAAGIPGVVHTIHGLSFNRTQPLVLRAAYCELERLCAGVTHRLISVAEAMTRQSLDAGIGAPDQYVTIYSGIETERFDPSLYDSTAIRTELGLAPEHVVVATVARLFRNKGYEQLIPAMAAAADREPRLRFLWIGDGADRPRYEARLRRLGLSERTTLVGLVPPGRIAPLLAAADLLAHASLWEGLPRAVVQALLMERPAVAFDLDGAPEVIRPGVCGELVLAGDSAALADALVSLARDPARRTAYGRAGRRECLARFDHRVMVQRIDEEYRHLSGNL